MKDSYLASIKSMCMSKKFLLNQLKYHCFPKGSAYTSLRDVYIKMLSGSLWDIGAEE